MKRFSLKVSQSLFDEIKKKGTQQLAVKNAIEYLLSSKQYVLPENPPKLERQISFSLNDEQLQDLYKLLKIDNTRTLLKVLRYAISQTIRKESALGSFLKYLDPDLQNILKKRIRDEWTHDSTAIEGNTLTLGETSFILNEGLTISGKSVKEHDEVRGHANAIELIYHLSREKDLTENQLYDLHRAVIVNPPFDIDNPVGAWKKRENGAYWNREYILYPSPRSIPKLMKQWLEQYNSYFDPETPTEAVHIYTWVLLSFTSIHPFYDGNGRLARLLANLKVIKQGFPPITIDSQSRFTYLELIKGIRLLEPYRNLKMNGDIQGFEQFIYQEWQKTLKLVDEVRSIQRLR
jgi:Fic family protein